MIGHYEHAYHLRNSGWMHSGRTPVAGHGASPRERMVGPVILLNSIQLGITILAGQTWNRWFSGASIFHLKEHFSDWSSALTIYLFSTFVYYWWHRYRHESQFLWRTLHQIHHSARRLEIVTSFYKHPVEIWINSILSSLIVYPLFGDSVRAASYYTILIAVGEFFYHWNINTPSWLGFIFQRPESHRVHHQFHHHTNNFADIPLWDMLFGTFKNPKKFKDRCGYENWREDRFEDMLLFRDVHAAGAKKLEPLHFLPTCIGCSKRWACTTSRNPQPKRHMVRQKPTRLPEKLVRAFEMLAFLSPTPNGALAAISTLAIADEHQDNSADQTDSA
jgi:sterol desaturase/sphingolipid hydroxylase (fatty acid hydroxylase superfamily)